MEACRWRPARRPFTSTRRFSPVTGPALQNLTPHQYQVRTETKMPKKVQVSFDDSALAIIARLQKASGATSLAEVLRAAVGLYDWAHEQIQDGYAVGAFKEGVPVKEVVLFRQAKQTTRKR